MFTKDNLANSFELIYAWHHIPFELVIMSAKAKGYNMQMALKPLLTVFLADYFQNHVTYIFFNRI